MARLARLALWALFALWTCTACGIAHANTVKGMTTITYPRPDSDADVRYVYYWRLLEAALHSTTADYGPFELKQTALFMTQERAMEALVDGKIQVYVRAVLPPDYAQWLDVVPVPLDKGLSGYRVLLIHKDTQPRLAKVDTLADLRAFTMGQGQGWADVDVLTRAGFRVLVGNSYEGLFGMLEGKRFDAFPRGINEVVPEWERHKSSEPSLVIERTLLLAYPLARYFMVSQGAQGQLLKQRLLLGLARMQADGRMDRLYAAYKKDILRGVDLRGRKLIRIDNPVYRQPIYGLQNKANWDTLQAELKP